MHWPGRPRSPTVSLDPGLVGLSRPISSHLGHSKALGTYKGRGEGRDTATATSAAESPAADDAYADIPGFCKSATLDELRKHAHVLTPGRYVGAAPQKDDGEPFEQKMARLTTQQQAEARRLDAAIEENLARLGFGK